MDFKVLSEKDRDGWFDATFSVLTGCVSQGNSEEDALENIKIAIELRISMLAGDGARLSRDIVNAAATGVIAGRGIVKKGDEHGQDYK